MASERERVRYRIQTIALIDLGVVILLLLQKG